MANFNDIYYVIECGFGGEFISGGNSKTNGLYSSKSKAVQQIKKMIKCYEVHLARVHNEKHRDQCIAEIERYKAMKVTEVKIVRVKE